MTVRLQREVDGLKVAMRVASSDMNPASTKRLQSALGAVVGDHAITPSNAH
jgi:hypothetical protein